MEIVKQILGLVALFAIVSGLPAVGLFHLTKRED